MTFIFHITVLKMIIIIEFIYIAPLPGKSLLLRQGILIFLFAEKTSGVSLLIAIINYITLDSRDLLYFSLSHFLTSSHLATLFVTPEAAQLIVPWDVSFHLLPTFSSSVDAGIL